MAGVVGTGTAPAARGEESDIRGEVFVVEENAESGRFDIVELAIADCPAERGDAQEGERQRERDQDVKDVHGVMKITSGRAPT